MDHARHARVGSYASLNKTESLIVCGRRPQPELSGEIYVASGKYLFTSEAVSMGHPDKLADQISDGVLDALFAQDPYSRVACETMVTTGVVVIAGEITTKAYVDMQQIVRDVVREVGYTDSSMGISADHFAVMVAIDEQSPDIAMGFNDDAS